MKLSEFIRNDAVFELTIWGGKFRYKPFTQVVKDSLPDKSYDRAVLLYPLAFECPLFCGEPMEREKAHRPTEIVRECLPEECNLPKRVGIFFLSDAIDALVYGTKLKYSTDDVANIVANIENKLESEGFSMSGRANSAPKED